MELPSSFFENRKATMSVARDDHKTLDNSESTTSLLKFASN